MLLCNNSTRRAFLLCGSVQSKTWSCSRKRRLQAAEEGSTRRQTWRSAAALAGPLTANSQPLLKIFFAEAWAQSGADFGLGLTVLRISSGRPKHSAYAFA